MKLISFHCWFLLLLFLRLSSILGFLLSKVFFNSWESSIWKFYLVGHESIFFWKLGHVFLISKKGGEPSPPRPRSIFTPDLVAGMRKIFASYMFLVKIGQHCSSKIMFLRMLVSVTICHLTRRSWKNSPMKYFFPRFSSI